MKLRLVAACLAVLALGACQPTSQEVQETHDEMYPDSVLVQKYGIQHVIVGKNADSECVGSNSYGYRVNFQKGGKTYSGVACHDRATPNWSLEIDTGSILLNADPSGIPAPPPATTPQP